MLEADVEADGPSIRALGSLFKVTQVFLWDESSLDGRRGSSLPKHIRFKYDDEENKVEEDGGSKVDSTTSPVAVGVGEHTSAEALVVGEYTSPEALGVYEHASPECHGIVGEDLPNDMDIIQQMSSLGLPLSFYTNKERKGTARGKRKVAQQSSRQYVEKDNMVAGCGMPLADDQVDVSESGDKLDSLRNTLFSHGEKDLDDEMTPLYESTQKIDGLTSDVQSNNGSLVEHFASDIASEQLQASGVALSGTTDCDGDGSFMSSFGDWNVFWDPYYMRNYFYNVKTQESTWYVPPGLESFSLCDMPSEPHESNSNVVIMEINPASSSNESELIDSYAVTNRSLEGGFSMNGVCQPELACDTVSSVGKLNDDCSQLIEADCLDMTTSPNSSMDIEGKRLNLGNNVNLIGSEEVIEDEICHVIVESVESMQYDVGGEDSAGVTKKTKKARKKRSRKKSCGNGQEKLFQCSVEAYCGGIGKYWWQRYLLFSKFDEGIQMDEEGWYSVTPEVIASHQASRCGGSLIIDCFVGVGGNAIQFAKSGKNVIAIDIDPNKIQYACDNASIYGVKDHIDFITGDSFSLAPTLRADAVFMSPPWGGPDYNKVKAYDLAMLKPHDGHTLFSIFKEISPRVVMFLPRNVDFNQLAELCLSVDPPWSVEVEKNFLNGRLKAITAYFCQSTL